MKIEVDGITHSLLECPKDEDGEVLPGNAGQFAVADGKGGIAWIDVVNASEVGA